MNNAVETFPMTMPSGWRGRTSEVPAQTSVLRVETPSPADLCVMKLESGRPKDPADVREMLGRDPAIAEGASAILSDPLEVQVNLDEGAWKVVRGRAAGVGIEVREGYHGPSAQDILEGARGAAGVRLHARDSLRRRLLAGHVLRGASREEARAREREQEDGSHNVAIHHQDARDWAAGRRPARPLGERAVHLDPRNRARLAVEGGARGLAALRCKPLASAMREARALPGRSPDGAVPAMTASLLERLRRVEVLPRAEQLVLRRARQRTQ